MERRYELSSSGLFSEHYGFAGFSASGDVGKQKVQSEIKSGRPNADMRGASKKKRFRVFLLLGLEFRSLGVQGLGILGLGFGALGVYG